MLYKMTEAGRQAIGIVGFRANMWTLNRVLQGLSEKGFSRMDGLKFEDGDKKVFYGGNLIAVAIGKNEGTHER